jgi:GT2 family glycosyltransferase
VFLEKCIKSLQKQTFQEFEIVLVYSIFPQGIAELLRECNIFSLKENASTLSAARNLGIKNSKGDIVVFIDDDAQAPEDWLSKIYSTFNTYPSLACLGGVHLTPSDECDKSPLRFVEGSFADFSMGQTIALDHSAVGKIAGCNVAYRKAIFEKIGYLKENLRSGEDWEFNTRLEENGYSIRFDPAISVWHHRQGLKHAFWNNTRMAPFYLSWKTLKYARHEPDFASFYLTNLLFLILIATIFISPLVFSIFLLFLLVGFFVITILRTKRRDWKIVYYPLGILFPLARIMGFYFGLFKRLAFYLYRQERPKRMVNLS